MKRYDVCWAQLDPTVGSEIAKTRPVVIVSLDVLNEMLETVTVCPLTSVLHPTWRTRLAVRVARKPAEIAVDQIRTISKGRCEERCLLTGKLFGGERVGPGGITPPNGTAGAATIASLIEAVLPAARTRCQPNNFRWEITVWQQWSGRRSSAGDPSPRHCLPRRRARETIWARSERDRCAVAAVTLRVS